MKRKKVSRLFITIMLIAIALLFTLPYVITVANIGNIDNGGVICGYLALILMSSAYISIGLFTSSITNNQIVAFLLALFIGLFFHRLWNEPILLFHRLSHKNRKPRDASLDSEPVAVFPSPV